MRQFVQHLLQQLESVVRNLVVMEEVLKEVLLVTMGTPWFHIQALVDFARSMLEDCGNCLLNKVMRMVRAMVSKDEICKRARMDGDKPWVVGVMEEDPVEDLLEVEDKGVLTLMAPRLNLVKVIRKVFVSKIKVRMVIPQP